MISERNKEIVIEAWKIFKTRDFQRIADLFAEDAEWIAPKGNATAVALSVTNHMVGKEAIANFLSAGVHRLFKDMCIEFHTIVADGNTVVVEETTSAILPDRKVYKNDYCFFFVLQQGKITQVREYMDTYKGHQIIFGA